MSKQEESQATSTHMKFFELPVQLKNGSWIMLSNITSIICHASDQEGIYGAIEINTSKAMVYIVTGNKDAREYADLLGNQWRQSIIDRANHEAESAGLQGIICEPRNCPYADREAKPQDTVEDWHEKTGDI